MDFSGIGRGRADQQPRRARLALWGLMAHTLAGDRQCQVQPVGGVYPVAPRNVLLTGQVYLHRTGRGYDLLVPWRTTRSLVAVLVHPTDPFARPFLEQIQSNARGIGVRIQPVVARGDEDLAEAFAAMVTGGRAP
jgi:hypothetical protein